MTVKQFLYYFLLIIPVLNALADVTIYYFLEVDSKGFHLGLVRGVLLVGIHFLFTLRLLLKSRVSAIILVFLIYLAFIGLLSSSLRVTFLSGYLKWFSALMLYPLAFFVIENEKQLLALFRSFVIAGLIILINLVVAQFTQYGLSPYVEESFYTGGAGVGIANDLAFICLLFPLMYLYNKHFSQAYSVFLTILIFMFVIFIVLSMKRAPILGLILGFITYYFATSKKTNMLRGLIFFSILFMFFLPYFDDVLTPRLEARLETSEKLENEGRIQDITNAIREFREGSIRHKLFGSELFNSQQFFGPKYYGKNRMIHGDFTNIFYGAGIIGLFLYLTFLYQLIRLGLRGAFSKYLPTYKKDLSAIFLSVLFCHMLISFTGSGTLGSISIVYMSLGAMASIIYRNKQKEALIRHTKT